ncbi:MAG: V-type synthase subunit, partial [Bacteroidota bacterium]
KEDDDDKETLKEKIEDKLFSPELRKLIAKPLQDPKVISQLITAVVKAIDKEGIEVDLSAFIPSAVPAKSNG